MGEVPSPTYTRCPASVLLQVGSARQTQAKRLNFAGVAGKSAASWCNLQALAAYNTLLIQIGQVHSENHLCNPHLWAGRRQGRPQP